MLKRTVFNENKKLLHKKCSHRHALGSWGKPHTVGPPTEALPVDAVREQDLRAMCYERNRVTPAKVTNGAEVSP